MKEILRLAGIEKKLKLDVISVKPDGAEIQPTKIDDCGGIYVVQS